MNFFIQVPFVAFEGRRIYIEGRAMLDPQGCKLADVLGQILKDKLFTKTAIGQPMIQTATFLPPGKN